MARRTQQDKIEITGELVNRLQESKVLYLADFTGLNVKSITELRRRFRESGSRFITTDRD